MIDYAVVTAARNEGANLRRLGKSLADQHVRPSAWVIVENDSTDDTLAIATELARTNNWIRVISLAERSDGTRGAPIVRALRAGLESLGNLPEIIVNVDATSSPRGVSSGSLASAGEWPRNSKTARTCTAERRRRQRSRTSLGRRDLQPGRRRFQHLLRRRGRHSGSRQHTSPTYAGSCAGTIGEDIVAAAQILIAP